MLARTHSFLQLELNEDRWSDTELALLELLENACKYSAKDAPVTFSVSGKMNGEIQQVLIRVLNKPGPGADMGFLQFITARRLPEGNASLYLRRMQEILEDPEKMSGKLGLIRILCETPFNLVFKRKTGAVLLTAIATYPRNEI